MMNHEDNQQEMEKLLKKSMDVEVPREVTACANRHLEVFRRQMERSESQNKENIIMTTLQKIGSKKLGWAVGTAMVVLIIVLMGGLNPWDQEPRFVFADVAEQFRSARTLMCTLITTTQIEGFPDMRMEMAFKEPGFLRMSVAGGGVSIMDMTQKKGMTIIPSQKQFFEIDLNNLPSDVPSDQTGLNFMEYLRTLPNRADEVLEEREMDGRTVQGLRLTEYGMDQTFWIDVETGYPIRMEGELRNAPGVKSVMTDFQFNVDLDDSLFDLTPPEGYTPLNIDASEPKEEDLIEYLRAVATHNKAGLFPPVLNQEITEWLVKLKKAGMLLEEEEQTKEESLKQSLVFTKGVMFALQMKPENDFHYAGDGVKFGDAETPICWWKPEEAEDAGVIVVYPEGEEMFRVIYGDLSVRDVPSNELPVR